MRGFLISVEGINGSGEGTHADLLGKKLQEKGYGVEPISFPDYTTPIGGEIRRFLREEVSYTPEVRQLLFATNRWERRGSIESWLKEGKIVVANRYTPSGLAYGLANGLNLEWMINLERGLPPADLVIVIDISVDTHFKRVKGRDLYERDRKFLERVRAAYLKLAKKFKWVVVDGEKSIEEVSNEIWRVISRFL